MYGNDLSNKKGLWVAFTSFSSQITILKIWNSFIMYDCKKYIIIIPCYVSVGNKFNWLIKFWLIVDNSERATLDSSTDFEKRRVGGLCGDIIKLQ